MLKQLYVDFKILFRIPIVVFFNNVFPLFLATIMLISIGNIDIGNGYNFSDKYYLIALSLGIAPLAMVSFAISISELFSSGILERLYLFGVKRKNIIISQFIIHIMVSFIQLIITTIYLKLFFSLNLPNITYSLTFILTYMLTLISMLSIGLLIGLLFKNKDIVQVISMGVMFIVLLLIGGFGTYDQLPEVIVKVSKLIPLTYLAQNSFEIYSQNQYFINNQIVVSILYLIIITPISILLINKKIKFGK